MAAAVILLALMLLTNIIRSYSTGYLISATDIMSIRLGYLIAEVLLPFTLWCVANWSLTTLMNGEGSMKDIVIATAFALTPMILFNIPLTILSNFITSTEKAYYSFFNALSLVWSGALLIFGMMTTHQYTLRKTITTTILTVIAMLIIVLLAFLFVNLLQQVVLFFISIYKEITYRM